jgi:hypothetical protein
MSFNRKETVQDAIIWSQAYQCSTLDDKLTCNWIFLDSSSTTNTAAPTSSGMEKVYITPSPMGVGLHNPLTYETVYITPELCKMGQITPYNSFEKS